MGHIAEPPALTIRTNVSFSRSLFSFRFNYLFFSLSILFIRLLCVCVRLFSLSFEDRYRHELE